jgi:hypothetical protein
MITRSMKLAEEVELNQPFRLDRLVRDLRALPGVREVYRNPDGDLFYVAPRRTTCPRARVPGGRCGRPTQKAT